MSLSSIETTASDVPADVPANIPAQPTFALAPGLRGTADVLDYSDTENVKLFKAATRSLLPEDEKFNCESSALKDFLHLLKDRTYQYGWNTAITDIATDPTNLVNSPTVDLLTEYGSVTLAQVRACAEAYVFGQTRAAQDSVMLYHCIMNSLGRTGRDKINVWEEEYKFSNPQGTDKRFSGACLLKVVIRESHIDTNATTSHIREQLSSLDFYMPSVNSDIEKFNLHVQTLLEQLAARGETTNDLLTNLFKGYKAVQDKKFVQYIELKEEKYEEGEDMSPQQLMKVALNKYNIRKLRGQWNAPSAEEEKILALEAKINRLQRSRNQRRNNNDNEEKSDNKDGQKSSRKKKAKKPKPEWMTTPPNDSDTSIKKQGNDKYKMVDGKKYFWCPKHKAIR